MPFDNRELHQCNVQIQRRRILAKSLLDDRSLAEVHMSKLTVLEKARDKKQKKLDELSGSSPLAAMKHGMLLNRSSKTEDLRMEVMTLSAEHREAVNVLQVISKRIADSEAELISIKGCEERYQILLREKKDYIISLDEPESAELAQMDRELQVLTAKMLSLQKAETFGSHLRDHIHKLVNETGNARTRGSSLSPIGGSVSIAQRNTSSANARILFKDVPKLLKQFSSDIRSINPKIPVTTDFESRFFSPNRSAFHLETGGEIEQAYQEVCRSRDELIYALASIQVMQQDTQEKRDRLSQKIEILLVNSTL